MGGSPSALRREPRFESDHEPALFPSFFAEPPMNRRKPAPATGSANTAESRPRNQADPARKASPRQEEAPDLLSPHEVAARLKVSTKTIRRWYQDGVLTPIPFGRLVRIQATEVARLARRGWRN